MRPWLFLLSLLAVPALLADWRYAEVDNLQILSNASDRDTNQAVEDIWRFRQGIREVVPLFQAVPERPLVVVVGRNKRTIAEFYHEDRSAKNLGGFYSYGPGHDLVVISTDLRGATQTEVIYHEYVHRLLEPLNLPAWAEEGLALSFQTLEFRRDELRFGKLRDWTLDWFYQEAREKRGRATPMSFETLFAVNRLSEEYHEEKLAPAFYAMSYFFVHSHYFSPDPTRRQQLFGFLLALRKEPPSEALFEKHFGKTYAEMEEWLGKEALGYEYGFVDVPRGKMTPPPPFSLADATPFQESLMLGHATFPVRAEASYQHYAKARRLDPARPEPLVGRAYLLCRDGDHETEADRIREAIELGTRNPAALTQMAYLRRNEIIDATDEARPLNATQVNELLGYLYEAMKIDSRSLFLYRELGEAWLAYEGLPPVQQVLIVSRGREQFPEDRRLAEQVLTLLFRLSTDADNEGLRASARREAEDLARTYPQHALTPDDVRLWYEAVAALDPALREDLARLP